jgi:hypothetical protein
MTDQTTTETASIEMPEMPTTAELRPHTRWGAIVWGLIVILTGTTVLTVLSDRERTEAFGDWLGRLTPGGVGVITVLAIGVLVLVLALLAVVRRAQRASTDRGMRN